MAWHSDGLTRKSLDTRTPRKVSVITKRGREYAAEHYLVDDDPDALRAEIARLEIMISNARRLLRTPATRAEVMAALTGENDQT